MSKKRFGLLGDSLTHSYSPFIHSELGSYEYNLYEIKNDDLDNFLKRGDFDGLNVTIPYKKSVIPYCRGLSETARMSGSVNTIKKLEDGSLYGDNTDFFGFDYLLKKTGVNPAAGKSIILGSGGSSLTVQAVLRSAKAKEIVVISRQGGDNYKNIAKHSDARIIINSTPAGMYPNNGLSPLADLSVFKNCEAVIDLIYNPSRTELLLQAEERGVYGANGLLMLAAQAKKSAEIFTETLIADEKIEEIAIKIASKTRNIILIGMPGCGKTSIGKELAKISGRAFADTDEKIIKDSGKSIPEIFSLDGEDEFRALESGALRSLCKESGLVIATGGGIVKRSENLRIMRQNGIIVFLDRDIGRLEITGRPLSEKEGLNKLAEERLPLYSRWNDYAVKVSGVNETARALYQKLIA